MEAIENPDQETPQPKQQLFRKPVTPAANGTPLSPGTFQRLMSLIKASSFWESRKISKYDSKKQRRTVQHETKIHAHAKKRRLMAKRSRRINRMRS